MADGPPWIQSILPATFSVGGLNRTHRGYAIKLDENRHYLIEVTATRAAGTNNELSLKLLRDQALVGNIVKITWNDLYPEYRGPWVDYKFDNQEIFVLAQYKVRPDPNDSNWQDCGRSSGVVAPGGTGEYGTISFGLDNGTTLVLKVARFG
jgi:hypothetical protein